MTIELHPTKCNLCGGRVEYVSNSVIYGREYGSGSCYRCTGCGAYAGTHRPRPREALGILADKEMREWKMKCHAAFDPMWKHGDVKTQRRRRRKLYAWLAGELGIQVIDCHFGYFDLHTLKRAFVVLARVREGAGA